jgi:muramoyltetrapeptide carboxypeptidase
MQAFDRIAGLVLGRFPSAVRFEPDDTLAQIVATALEGTDFPVAAGADFSHTDPLLTIPIGVRTRIDTEAATLTFLEPSVR